MPHKKQSFNIIFDLRDVIFNYHPEHYGTKEQFSVIKDGLALLLKCHAQTDQFGKRRHKLFVLSNANADFYQHFMAHHPDIFRHFDGIVMSAQSGFSKPDAKAYLYLIKKYDLKPDESIFIDDKEVNVLTARALGMHGIVCNNHQHAMKALKELGAF